MPIPTQPKLTGAPLPPAVRSTSGIDLYWLPLGAGGHFVRLNGRIYEAIQARLERRRPLDLYHSALEVQVPEGRFVIENSWPIPDAAGTSRGVAVEGPVGSRGLAHFRVFRYEVRCWRGGVIADADEAVESPQRLSDDPSLARYLLDLTGSVPALVWGRDELGAGEMWNSNSVIAWLLARSGLPAGAIRPPANGRAPGWDAGLLIARDARAAPRGARSPRAFPASSRPSERPSHEALPQRAASGGHKTEHIGKRTRATSRDASSVAHVARFAGETVSRMIARART